MAKQRFPHIELRLSDSDKMSFELARDRNGNPIFEVSQAPGLGEAARPEDASYAHLPPSQAWSPALTDFSGGVGIFEEDPLRPETMFGYQMCEGVNASSQGKLILWPEEQFSWIDGVVGAGLNNTFRGGVNWRGNRMVGAGRAIYRWNGTAVFWVLWDDSHAADTIRHLYVFDNNLIVQWTAETHFHIFTDPADNTVVTANGVFGAAVYRFASVGNNIYCAVGAARTVRAYSDAADAVDANWLTFTVGDNSADMNEMWSARDVIWCGKDDGLYGIDRWATGGDARCVVSLARTPSDDNFRAYTVWGDWIWAAIGQGRLEVLVYNMATGEYFRTGYHPRYIAPRTPQLHGPVFALYATDAALYMVLQRLAGYGQYNFYLVEVTERNGKLVYHPIAGDATIGPAGIMVDYMAGMTNPVIWWFRDTSPYEPAYFILPNGRPQEDDSACRFDTGADRYLVTSWIQGNFIDINKALYRILAETRNLLAGSRTVSIFYQVDNAADTDAWTLLATLTSNGWSASQYFNNGVAPRRVRSKIRLTTSANTSTPIFEKLVLHGRLMSSGKDIIGMAISCIPTNLHDAKELRERLYSYRDSNAALTLTDFMANSWIGSILRDTFKETVQLDEFGNVSNIISFTFLQADAQAA